MMSEPPTVFLDQRGPIRTPQRTKHGLKATDLAYLGLGQAPVKEGRFEHGEQILR
jgi:hypothetical protein